MSTSPDGTEDPAEIEAGPTTIYWLDRSDRIVRVSESWDVFADANDGHASRSEAIHARTLWDFVTGDATRMWMRALMVFARVSRTQVERPYRCDSPDERRYMRMRIVVEDDGGVRVENTVLRTEPRDRPVRVVPAPRSSKLTTKRCSVCGRIDLGGRWVEPDLAALVHLERSRDTVFRVVYGVCETCMRMLPDGFGGLSRRGDEK